MAFYKLSSKIKAAQIKRIMKESASTFTHDNTARQYIALYEKMLQRPLIGKSTEPVCSLDAAEENLSGQHPSALNS